MAVGVDDGFSLTTPLMHDEDQHSPLVIKDERVEDVESNTYLHRIGTSSFFKTCFNGLNALSGVGILSVPYALSEGGWLSLILLFLIASATFYTALLIRKCMDVDKRITTYPEIGELAFGYKGRMVISVFMYAELYLVATGFLILEGDNLHNLFPNMILEVSGLRIGGRESFIIIVALIILPSVWLDNLSILSYVSATGVLASFIIICSVFWTGAVDGVGFHGKGRLLNLSGIPTAISLYAFCYCAHPVFPTLYTSMRHQHQFSKVLLFCFVVCTMSYASMAILGYLMYGSDISSQVTLNLPTGKLSSKIAIYTTLVNPITKYALMITPIVSAIENWLPCHYKNKLIILLIRSLLLISTVIVALTVPFFESLMALVGAFLSATASIILPCLCYLKISGNYRRWGTELVIVVGIVLMGVLVVVVGTYTSLLEIVDHL
ncbi:amino acid transporter AVT1I-like [Macadamia integrifolia]|uniref:amino acid transporter AVT1I-like n=1 Tax=Macadamia integrifolia TaxID=60698 RepID=UPI001C4F5FA9|nr:amino acid transporter AVT1I-like [Macadamia integrifolia]